MEPGYRGTSPSPSPSSSPFPSPCTFTIPISLQSSTHIPCPLNFISKKILDRSLDRKAIHHLSVPVYLLTVLSCIYHHAYYLKLGFFLSISRREILKNLRFKLIIKLMACLFHNLISARSLVSRLSHWYINICIKRVSIYLSIYLPLEF